MKLKPFGNNVLVKPLSTTEVKTDSGIYVATTLNGLTQGEIISYGGEVSSDLMVGSRAFYSKEQARELPFKGTTYDIIPEEAIIATEHD